MYKPFNFKNLTGEDIHCLEKCLTFQAQIPVSEQMTKLVDGSTDQLVQRLEFEPGTLSIFQGNECLHR